MQHEAVRVHDPTAIDLKEQAQSVKAKTESEPAWRTLKLSSAQNKRSPAAFHDVLPNFKSRNDCNHLTLMYDGLFFSWASKACSSSVLRK